MKYKTKKSKSKEKFKTGAHRDSQKDKLRYDLITPYGLKRLAGIYTRGAKIYGDRNWELGMPMSRLYASAVRHLYQYAMHEPDEDHLAACVWNLMAIMHFEETGRKDL